MELCARMFSPTVVLFYDIHIQWYFGSLKTTSELRNILYMRLQVYLHAFIVVTPLVHVCNTENLKLVQNPKCLKFNS